MKNINRCNSNGLDTKSIVSSSRGGVEGNHNTIELPNENKRYYTLTTKTERGVLHSDTYLDSIAHIVDVYEKHFNGKPNPFERTIDVYDVNTPLTNQQPSSNMLVL